jgi:chromosome segregation protein
MFLRALTLKGFKSFADTATLEMEPGVTVVVGPNGSGKSNVVDALAWVLGAQAPSAVRSQKMEDVIFAGTTRRAALGRAEVAITIDNSRGLLPVDVAEVTVTRTLWRNGDSEYAINGVPCRLLDVQELLSDAGVGRQQHVIVSQGQIDAVLNARDTERRSIIEEAAGVLKHRKRKERAERRLEATEQNLVRVNDLLREVRRQLRPLEKQAEAARRHAELSDEQAALALHLAGVELGLLGERMLAAEAVVADLAETEDAQVAVLAAADAEVADAESRLSAVGGVDAAEVTDRLRRAEQLRERARGQVALIAERRRSTERSRDALMDGDVVATLVADAEAVRAELAQVERDAEALLPEGERLVAAEAELAGRRADVERRVAEAPRVSVGRAAEVRGELAGRRQAAERAAAEVTRTEGRVAALRAKAERATGEVARLREECVAAEVAEVELVAALDAARSRSATAQAAEAAAEDERSVADGEARTWAARAEALAQALDAARARAGAQRLAGVAGVTGALVELVVVDPGYEAAFEAAAGDALAAVVVADPAAARRALQTLAEASLAGAVVPERTGGVAPRAVPGSLRRHVRGRDAAVEALLDRLLAGVDVVDGDWSSALDAVTGGGGSGAGEVRVVVTRTGDRFGPSGWRLGAGGGGVTAAALDEARAKAAECQARSAVTRTAHEAARAEARAARVAEAEAQQRLDANDRRFARSAESLERALLDQRDAVVEADGLEAALGDLAERAGRERARVDELAAQLPGLEAEEAQGQARARELAVARRRVDEQAAAVGALRADLQTRAAQLEERRAFLRRRAADIEARLVAHEQRRVEAERRRRDLERTLAALGDLAVLVEAQTPVLEATIDDLTERRRHQSQAARALAEELDVVRRRRSAADRALTDIRDRRRRADADADGARLRAEAAIERCGQTFGCGPEEAMAAPCPPLPDGVDAAQRRRDVERALDTLGPVNPLALEEFTALKERHDLIEEQLDDVKRSKRELQKVIDAVDAEIEQVFAQAFADVAANFETLFGRLFPGGQGRLVLTDPGRLLETGIEVEAKPSGKNVKKLSLLSGGERSLTALAFLFAVFRSRPSPFYVMDEVEAALDDVNLHRFLGLVDEFRDEAQLIIVSHQKRTMEAADCLYGVTMSPGGSSKVVSEKVRSG